MTLENLLKIKLLEAHDTNFLDTFRIKRNAIDYTGGEVDDNSVKECISAAKDLQQQVSAWLIENTPELIE